MVFDDATWARILVAGKSPEAIVRELTDGPGSGSIDEARAALDTEAQRQRRIEARVSALRERMAAGWRGQAAEAASDAAQPMATHAAQACDVLEEARATLTEAAYAFEHAKASVVPMPPHPREADLRGAPFSFLADYAAARSAYEEAAQHNKNVYQALFATCFAAGSALPLSYEQASPTAHEASVTGG